MGSGASQQSPTSETHGTKPIEDDRHIIINKIEKFIFEVYRSYPTATTLKLLLSSYLANLAFENYIKSLENKNLVNDLKVYQTINNFLELMEDGIHLSQNQINNACVLILDSTVSDKEKYCEQLQGHYETLIMSQKATNITTETKNGMKEVFTMIKDIILEEFAKKKLVAFLYSKYYRNWRATEYGHAIATTVEDHSNQNTNLTVGDLKKYSSTGCLSTRSVRPNLSFAAFDNLENNEMETILGKNNWISALIAGVEGLPVGFSVSTSSDKDKYPIFFVNSYFENIFGIVKDDILAKPSPLWSLPLLENEKENIFTYMKLCKEYTTVLIYPKDNENHFYVVSIKPVFNHKNKYKQVLTMYVDLGLESSIDITAEKGQNYISSQKSIVQYLMELLPNMTLEIEVE